MAKFRVLMIDDDPEICEGVKVFLERTIGVLREALPLALTYETSFDAGLELLDERLFDAVILDVRIETEDEDDLDAGPRLLEEIKATRFIPIIFYTGLPQLVSHMDQSPLVQVVRKELGPNQDGLLQRLQNIDASVLPKISQALAKQVATIQKDYMWNFVSQYWEEVNENQPDTSLFYLIARRLSLSLSSLNIDEFISNALGNDFNAEGRDLNIIPPERYYIMPPIGNSSLSGDIYLEEIPEEKHNKKEWAQVPPSYIGKRYWIVLTPSCDFAQGKAEKALLARCHLFEGFNEYRVWKAGETKTNKENLAKLLKNNPAGRQQGRFQYLPGALELPHLLVDFQDLLSLTNNDLNNWRRVASLDSPFAEKLLAEFGRYFTRVGTPDLNLELVLNRLRNLELHNPPVEDEN